LVDKGNSFSAFRLAYSYNETNDYNNAIKYYIQYIEKTKYEGAMRNLGLIYQQTGNKKEAQKWFKKAFDIYLKKARSEDKDAMKWLYFMYLSGEGTPQNTKKALYWLNKKNK